MDKRESVERRPPGSDSGTGGKPGVRETEVIGANLWPSSDESGDEYARPEWQYTDIAEGSLLPTTRGLYQHFPVAGMEKSYLRFLQHRIQRDPRDLLSHVRRVMAEDERGDSEAIHGALLDLFLVLGRRGRRLRDRLFYLVAERLTEEQRRFFQDRLQSGVDASDVSTDVPRSRLSQQVAGTNNIVIRQDAVDNQCIDAIGFARAAIADGRDDLAQALLEGALEADPGDTAVCRELLTLYRRKNLRADLLRTYTTLLSRRLALPDQWRELAAEFRA